MFKGDLVEDLVGDLAVELEGDSKGYFKQNLEGDLLSRSGPGQVWFSFQLRFNYLELDTNLK